MAAQPLSESGFKMLRNSPQWFSNSNRYTLLLRNSSYISFSDSSFYSPNELKLSTVSQLFESYLRVSEYQMIILIYSTVLRIGPIIEMAYFDLTVLHQIYSSIYAHKVCIKY